MANVINVISRSPWRVTVTLDAAPSVLASDYVLSRADNTTDPASSAYAFIVAGNTVELALTNPLVDAAVYNLKYQGGPALPVAYRLPLNQSQVPVSPAEDPEAEIFGIDIDWFADSFTADGDTPTVRGRQCLINDLAVVSLIQKGELFHRPDAGAGVKLNTNGPMSSSQVKQVTGSLTREWYKDPRVKQGGITIKADVSASTGQLTIYGTVLPVAIDDPTVVKLPGGGT